MLSVFTLLLAAPFIGSFLGTLISRLPEGRPVVFDRSRCEACGHVLGAGDMVPLFSWLLLKGRCRHCGAKLGIFYPLIELAALGVALWALLTMPPHLAWPTAALGWVLLALALIGLFLIIVAFRSLWLHGTRGGRRASWALFLTFLTLFPFCLYAFAWIVTPHQSDVSTDVVDPPLLVEETNSQDGNPAALVASRLKDGYPHLSGRRFKAPPEAIEETILRTAEKQGWTLVSRRGRIGADDELYFEFAYTIPVLAIPGSVVLRLSDEGDTSFVDMRARTEYVTHDLGWNARLIDRYLKALDFDLIGIVAA